MKNQYFPYYLFHLVKEKMDQGKLRLNNLGALLQEKRKAGQFIGTEARQKGGSSNYVNGCQCLPFSGCRPIIS